jgi:hypothetical protein
MDDQSLRDLVELATIERWNQRFGREEQNSISYLARERRRWELCLKLKSQNIDPEAALARMRRRSE